MNLSHVSFITDKEQLLLNGKEMGAGSTRQ